jgi:hypothetical protein
MRRLEWVLTVFLGVSLILPASAAPRPHQSWGKAGVSFDEYRRDAVECGRLAHYADVSDTEQAKLFVRASKRLEAADDHGMGTAGASSVDEMNRMVGLAARSEQIRSSIRPEKQMRDLHAGLVGVVESCLTERGYSRFSLTEGQRARLGKLKKGSAERHRFLHSLASDADVLRRQVASLG